MTLVRPREWFSAMLVSRVTIDGQTERFHRSVSLFRAADWDRAFARALQIGYSQETSHRNADDLLVEYRFHLIETIDLLGWRLGRKREVYAEPDLATPTE